MEVQEDSSKPTAKQRKPPGDVGLPSRFSDEENAIVNQFFEDVPELEMLELMKVKRAFKFVPPIESPLQRDFCL